MSLLTIQRYGREKTQSRLESIKMTAKTIFIGIHCFIDSYVHLQTINKTVNTNTLQQQITTS